MMAGTDLEEHKGLAKNRFLPIVKTTIGHAFKGKGTVDFKITKEVVQNFEKQFKDELEKDKTTFAKDARKQYDKLDGYIKKFEKLDEKIKKLRDSTDTKLKAKIEKEYGKVFNQIVGNGAYSTMFTKAELLKMKQGKLGIYKLSKFSNLVTSRARKTMGVIDKAIKIAEVGDFINTLYKLKNSETDDNVQYFLDVKKAFNTGGDYLEGAFGEIPSIGSFIKMYNKAFKSIDGALKIIAEHPRRIEQEYRNIERAQSEGR